MGSSALISAIVGAIAGACAGAAFALIHWALTDKWDLKNNREIIYDELTQIERNLNEIWITKSLKDPFTIIYPTKGRLYDIKISFIRFKDCSRELTDVYYRLIEIDERIRLYQSDNNKNFKDLEQFYDAILDLRNKVKEIKEKMKG